MSDEETLRKLVEECPDLLCLSGSRLYGTNREDSDYDYRGFVLPTFPYLIGLKKFNDMEVEGADHKVYSLQRWIDLTLKGDPQCTEMLFTPEDKIFEITEIGELVLDNKDAFLSSKIYWRIVGYSNSEWRKAQGVKLVPAKRLPDEEQVICDIRNVYKPDKATMDEIIYLLEKNKDHKLIASTRKLGKKRKAEFEKFGFGVSSAAHSIRLIGELIELLDSGSITFPRPNADFLRDIRQGNVPFDDVEKLYFELRGKAEEALEKTCLPQRPDTKKVESLYASIVADEMQYMDMQKFIKK